jgi:hypothetical protein
VLRSRIVTSTSHWELFKHLKPAGVRCAES